MSSPAPSDIPSIRSITVGGLEPTPTLPLSSGAPLPLVKHGPLSLTASARRISAKTSIGAQTQRRSDAGWARDAWDAFDLVGEQRFLATTLANQGSKARFFVGVLNDDDPLGDPVPTEDLRLAGILDHIGKNSKGRAQIVQRALVNYFVGGEIYYVGVPSRLVPQDEDTPLDAETAPATPTLRIVDRTAPVDLPADETTLADLRWYALSPREVPIDNGEAKLKLPELHGETITAPVSELWIIHSWRPHPERGTESDSPTRSSLPVLRELIGLTMMVSAQIDSRLAGAGMLLVAQKVSDAAKIAAGYSLEDDEDPFTDALLDTMSTPIADRSSAASYAPLVTIVPDGVSMNEAAKHITFASVLDPELRPLREEAIRRLALGEDAPPELLLGVSDMNHWGAWLVREDVVNTHIEPPLSIVADSWTTKYLRPAMRAAGYAEEQIENTVVWYSVDHMIARPNRSADAQAVYDKGELSGDALRRETGFDETDAPQINQEDRDPAVDLALQLVSQNPSLMASPGLPAIVEQIRAVLAGHEATAEAAAEARDAAAPEPIADEGGSNEPPADGAPRSVADAAPDAGAPE